MNLVSDADSPALKRANVSDTRFFLTDRKRAADCSFQLLKLIFGLNIVKYISLTEEAHTKLD